MNASFVTAFIMLASIFSGPAGAISPTGLGSARHRPGLLYPNDPDLPDALHRHRVDDSRLYAPVRNRGGPIAPVLLASVPEVAAKPAFIGIGMSAAALGPEHRDVHRPQPLQQDPGGSGMGDCGLLDDPHLHRRPHRRLEDQGSLGGRGSFSPVATK